MPFVPAPDTVMVEMRYTYQGQNVENTLYFQNAAGPDPANMGDLGLYLIEQWTTEVQPTAPASLTLREVYITSLESATAPAVTVTTGLPASGATGSPAAPNNVSLCVSFRTEGRGRSARGRNYLLGVLESSVDNNLIDTTFTNPWTSFFNSIVVPDWDGSGWMWVIVSRISGGVERAEALVQQVITFTYVDRTVDSQRRRLPGRGT
jgi:hypothetical protein